MKMYAGWCWISLALIPMPGHAAAQEGQCVATFDATASFGHDFNGAATSKTFAVTYEGTAPGSLVSFTVDTDFDEVTTFHKKRDKEMREHFHADEHPSIQGRVSKFPVATLKGATGTAPVELPFEMVFMGVTNALTATVTECTTDASGGLGFTAGFTFSHKAFGVKPKSMIGLFKVKDPVEVQTRFTLPPPAAP